MENQEIKVEEATPVETVEATPEVELQGNDDVNPGLPKVK